MPEGPEPTGWELMRMLDNARANVRKDIADLENALDTRMATREWVGSEIQRVLDQIENNTQQIDATNQAIERRIESVEAQKQQSGQFRRAVLIAAITVLLTSAASIIITLIHAASQ